MPENQRTQDHHASLLRERLRRVKLEFFQDELREPLEGEDVKPRVTLELRVSEQLTFKLRGGLLGREQQERRAVRRRDQFTADFREAAEGLAAASGAEQKSRLHGDVFNRKRGARQKNKDFYFWG